MSRRIPAILAAFSLALHVIVPPGFMPASVDDGWHLKWCPDGMSAELMYALFGHAHHHHDSDAAQEGFQQCDLSVLSAELALALHILPVSDVDNADRPAPRLDSLFLPVIQGYYHSRAPPRALRT